MGQSLWPSGHYVVPGYILKEVSDMHWCNAGNKNKKKKDGIIDSLLTLPN